MHRQWVYWLMHAYDIGTRSQTRSPHYGPFVRESTRNTALWDWYCLVVRLNKLLINQSNFMKYSSFSTPISFGQLPVKSVTKGCSICRYSRFTDIEWAFKDRAHLSTFKFFIFEKFSCFIVLVVFFGYCPIIRLISVWFCKKRDIFISYHIFAIYVGVASLGLPTACRLIAVSGARLLSADGLVVRCIKMHHHVKSAITICLQFVSNIFTICKCIPTHRGSARVFMPTKSSAIRYLCKLD